MKYSKFFATLSRRRFFFTACMALVLSASAQDETVLTSEPTSTMTKTAASGDYDHGFRLMPEIKVGGYNGVFGFGANLVLEHEFHRYFAWDIVSLDTSAPYDFSEGCVGLKTGLRYFTPRFAKNKMRGYISAAVGYQCCIKEVVDYYDPDEIWISAISGVTRGRFHLNRKPLSGFGVSAGIGFQFKKHFFVGYTMEYSGISYTPSVVGEEEGKYTSIKEIMPKIGGFLSHFGRVGYRF